MNARENMLTARIAALILVFLLALGAWAQKMGRFESDQAWTESLVAEVTPEPVEVNLKQEQDQVAVNAGETSAQSMTLQLP